SVEGAHTPDGAGTGIVESQGAVGPGGDNRYRQEGLQVLLAEHGTGAGTAAAVRRRERLVQVQVHDVHAKVAGANLADQRVHVGAVHIELAALGVQDIGNLIDLLLENSQRVGIGKHEGGDVLVHLRRQCADVHHPGGIGFQVLHRVTADGGSRRIGAVGGVRNQNFLARVPLRFQIGTHHQNPRHLSVGAGGGLERDGVHAADFGEVLAQ